MAAIELRFQRLAQLFDSLDPSPFHDKALDPKAEEYILSSAREHGLHDPLELRLHLPESARGEVHRVEAAVHAHFRLAHEAAQRHYRQRMRVGRAALIIGLVVLAACLGLRSLVANGDAAWRDAVGEGLLILGWVALWRPVEILLFERWESRGERAWLARLAIIPVRFAFAPDEAPR